MNYIFGVCKPDYYISVYAGLTMYYNSMYARCDDASYLGICYV